jgi:hypothetical protein
MTESKPYNGLLGLDRLPTWIKTVIWIAAFLLATYTCAREISQSLQMFGNFNYHRYSIPYEIYAIYIIAPAAKVLCFTGAGLRLAGIRWLYVLIFLAMTSVLVNMFSGMVVAAATYTG